MSARLLFIGKISRWSFMLWLVLCIGSCGHFNGKRKNGAENTREDGCASSVPDANRRHEIPAELDGEGEWKVLTDKLWCKGSTEAELTPSPDTNGERKIGCKYTAGKKWGGDPFAELVLEYPGDKNFFDGLEGIRFRIRGDCGTIRLVFGSSNISDYNYWGITIKDVGREGEMMELSWDDLKPAWGRADKSMPDSMRAVNSIRFKTEKMSEGDSGCFEVDSLSLVFSEKGRSPLLDEHDKAHLDVNQAFYGHSIPKKAVLRCRRKLDDCHFLLSDSTGKTIFSCIPRYWGEKWGWHYWKADFSEIREKGEYWAKVHFTGGSTDKMLVNVGEEPILEASERALFYFNTQKCGIEVPGWHKVCHLDDAKAPDGRHIDATGGWHDCAGFDKEMYTTFLPVYFFTDIAMESKAETKDLSNKMIDAAKWGADWIMKMTDDNGYTWCHVEPHNLQPEEFKKKWRDGTDTDNMTGTTDDRILQKNAWGPEEAVQAACAGALAKLAFATRESDPGYSAKCAAKAKLMLNYLKGIEYSYATVPIGKGKSHYNLFHSGVLLADIFLHRIEGGDNYLTDAKERIDFIERQCKSSEDYLTSNIERVPVSGRSFDPYFNMLCYYEFAKAFPKDGYSGRIRLIFQEFMDKITEERIGASPYGQAQIIDCDIYNQNGLYIAFTSSKRDFENPSGNVSQGKNCYWLSLAVVSLCANELLETNKYSEIAVDQIGWILGMNPFGASTVAATGSKFPRMFTMWYWLEGHPAENGQIPGGVINGIGGDKKGFPVLDMRNSNWVFWETNEYWNPPTAWFSYAAWKYYTACKRH